MLAKSMWQIQAGLRLKKLQDKVNTLIRDYNPYMDIHGDAIRGGSPTAPDHQGLARRPGRRVGARATA
eukprot:6213795-Pleurochrysis_carterae.AAC.4